MPKNIALVEPNRVREELDLSYEKMGRILDVSGRTIQRWQKETPKMRPEARLRLAKVQQILELGHLVYGQEGFKIFLNTPLREFGNRTVLQLMEAGDFERILAALAADYEGLGY